MSYQYGSGDHQPLYLNAEKPDCSDVIFKVIIEKHRLLGEISEISPVPLSGVSI